MDAAAARRHLLADHRNFVGAVLACADAAATPATDRDAVVGPFRAALELSGALDAAPAVLAACVDAAGGDLRAQPVADPPYVVVTSTGLVLRATLDGGRLVVRIDPFAVERDPTRYIRRRVDPDDAVSARLERG